MIDILNSKKDEWIVVTTDYKNYRGYKRPDAPESLSNLHIVHTGTENSCKAFIKANKRAKFDIKDTSYRVVFLDNPNSFSILDSAISIEPNVGKTDIRCLLTIGSRDFCHAFVEAYANVKLHEKNKFGYGLYWKHYSNPDLGLTVIGPDSFITNESLIKGKLSEKEAFALKHKYEKGGWYVVSGNTDENDYYSFGYKIVDTIKKGDTYFFNAPSYADCIKWVNLVKDDKSNVICKTLTDVPNTWSVWKTHSEDSWPYSYGESGTIVADSFELLDRFDNVSDAFNVATDMNDDFIKESDEDDDNEDENMDKNENNNVNVDTIISSNPILKDLSIEQTKEILSRIDEMNFKNRCPLILAAKEFSSQKSDKEAFISGARWCASITIDKPENMSLEDFYKTQGLEENFDE